MEVLYEVYSLKSAEVDHFVQRVGQQLRILTNLKHDNILEFLGWISPEDEGPLRVIAVSSKCEGGEIMTFLRALDLKDENRRQLVLGVSQGLAYLHSEDVVHGNLNPGKIFVDWNSGHPVAKIGGFDLCYLLSETPIHPKPEYRTSRIVRYTAPEVLTGHKAECDMGGDVWSFACISLEVV
ncbi:kinase-like domain-containing protein [Cantharellus anzutake]|uniref:kinase-like domain-containing protein n=1 Tax=Cantharellus anzutake TaxID=1750568 RepID=UPI00190436DE|nr:kinase-like domain-containing protein [Cantharellus anzutake]KAF8339169.1 kinase-like domain-containing protein [Cantharellus anzutake]